MKCPWGCGWEGEPEEYLNHYDVCQARRQLYPATKRKVRKKRVQPTVYLPTRRCPVCNKGMERIQSVIWSGAYGTFLDFAPRYVYDCSSHGLFIWCDGRYQLADLSQLAKEARKIPLGEETTKRYERMGAWERWGFTRVEIKCHRCGTLWWQHKERGIWCPICGKLEKHEYDEHQI